jgi:phosphohistidine phosphatase
MCGAGRKSRIASLAARIHRAVSLGALHHRAPHAHRSRPTRTARNQRSASRPMHLVVIRHAVAEDKEEFARTGRSDDLRPLTDDGRERMRKGAAGLRQLVPTIDVLATSPYVRAVQTAEVISAAYDGLAPTTVTALVPTKPPSALVDWLRTQRGDTIAVVGHEPHLTHFVSWILTGRDESILRLKKGAAVLLELENRVRSGEALLLWAVTPLQLRRFAP